jgi:cathepsin E
MLATDIYNRYVATTGAVYDDDTGLLRVTPANYKSRMLNMFFKPTGSKTQFSLTKNAQTWPRALNSVIGGTDDYVYLVVADVCYVFFQRAPLLGLMFCVQLGTNQGSGLDWILGYTALERLYTVFDSTNSRLGFATTPYTNATVN